MIFKFNETETELLRYACSCMVSEFSKQVNNDNKSINKIALLQRKSYEELERKLNRLW